MKEKFDLPTPEDSARREVLGGLKTRQTLWPDFSSTFRSTTRWGFRNSRRRDRAFSQE